MIDGVTCCWLTLCVFLYVSFVPKLQKIHCKIDASGFCAAVEIDLLHTVFQREELSSEGGRGAPQSQIQPHHPDLRHLQRTWVLLHSHRIHEQWLSGPVAPRGSYMGKHRALHLHSSWCWNSNTAKAGRRESDMLWHVTLLCLTPCRACL